MDLDFCFKGKLQKEVVPLFNRIALSIRQEFHDLICSVSQNNKDNIDWWMSGPASRNTFLSPLFHYCCCLLLYLNLNEKKIPIDSVITDSMAFLSIVKKVSKEMGTYHRCSFILLENGVIAKIKMGMHLVYPLLRNMTAWVLCRILIGQDTAKLSKDNVLIDTFIMNGFASKNRYFTGLLENLDEKEKNKIFFVPTFFGIGLMHIAKTIIKLKKAKANYLFKEKFLNFGDILTAWFCWIRIRRLCDKAIPTYFRGVNIAPLVKEELRSFKAVSSSMTGFMNYRFPMRLARRGFKVRLAIDWFENQVVDKGWNAGFKKFLPETYLAGYQGFLVTPHYLCMYPTDIELNCGLLPDIVLVTGKSLVNPIKEFCDKLHVGISPAFRFNHLWQRRSYYADPSFFTILLALPFMIEEASTLLRTVMDSLVGNSSNYLRYWVKKHPATNLKKIKNILNPWPKAFRIVQGNFNEIVEQCDILVTTASSVAMETIAKGIPVIIIGSQTGLNHNPIPVKICSITWRICYNTNEFIDAIQYYRIYAQKIRNEQIKIGKKIRSEYFEPVTPETVRKFLGFV